MSDMKARRMAPALLYAIRLRPKEGAIRALLKFRFRKASMLSEPRRFARELAQGL